jgi:PAS domain S-box-containing protein
MSNDETPDPRVDDVTQSPSSPTADPMQSIGNSRPLPGAADMRRLIGDHDWSATAIGAPAGWPQSLRTTIAVMLDSRFPMCMGWGDGLTLLYNDAYAPFLGARHPAALGRPIAAVWVDVWDDIEPLIGQAMAGTPTWSEDVPLTMTRNGYAEETWWTFSYSPLRDDGGKIVGFLDVCSDSTAKVLQERRLDAERERLTAMFEQAPGFMAMLRGPDHVFERINPAYRTLIGDRDTIGRPVAETLGDAAAQGYVEILDTVYRTGEPYAASGALYARQAEPGGPVENRYLDFVYQPMTDAVGTVTGILVQGIDITDRRAGEEALRASQARHRQIVDSATDTVIISTDLQGRVTSWSEGARRIIGYDEPEMTGKPIDLFFTPEDRAAGRMHQEMAEALVSGLGSHEGWRVRKNGSRFWASGQMQPIRDEHGNATGFVKIVRDRTIEREAIDALEASQDQLSLAQSAGGIGVFIVDVATNAIRVTPEFCRLYGVAPGMVRRPEEFEALVLAEDQDFSSHEDTRRLGTAPTESQYRIRRPSDGEIRWIQRSARLVRGKNGDIVQMLGVAQDITERKQAEETLRASEQLFRTFAQSMPNQVWTSPGSGHLDWFNDRVYDYTGLGYDDLADDKWANIVHPDDRPMAGARWAHSVQTGAPYETEFRIRRADGTYRWHLVRAVPIAGDVGVARWIGTNTDIDEQRGALETLETAVAERTADRDRMWRLSTDLMLVSDFAGRVLSVNPAWTRIFGWQDSEIVGRNFLDLIHPDDIAATEAEVTKLTQGITTLRFENRYQASDGSYRPLSWTAVPDSALIHAVGRDISTEKAAAAELEAAQDALRQAQKMEAVGQLTGGIAHDFNNLLTGIIGSLEMMQRRTRQGRVADVDRYATAAMTSANRAAALTHRLLAFSRRQPLDPRALDANALLAGMDDLLRRTIGEAVRLEIRTVAALWPTKCDPHQLENAILNLAINARDAMPDGGALTIETCNADLKAGDAAQSREVRPGQYVCIAVSDTGSGMSPDVIAKAFDPFFTTKPLGQGTGLGLSMIYGFARQSEGHARIESEVGRGTTVKILLPRHHGDADAAEAARSGLSDQHLSSGRERVLVVEDEAAVRALVVDVLDELGYEAIEAVDGPSGLAMLERDIAIDLLVTDVGLPGLNGRQLADAARVKRPGLKILFMTGYAENAAIDGLDAGMELITKPFAIETLAQRIREIIDG